MEFNKDKIINKKAGAPKRISDEELQAALDSGLFCSYSAIARYFGVTPSAISKRVQKLKQTPVPEPILAADLEINNRIINDYSTRVNCWGWSRVEAEKYVCDMYSISSAELIDILGGK